MSNLGEFYDPFAADQDVPVEEFPTANVYERPTYAPDPNAVPSGSAKEVLEWVGDDKDRAERAFEVEQEKPKPRVGLTNDLLDLLEA